MTLEDVSSTCTVALSHCHFHFHALQFLPWLFSVAAAAAVAGAQGSVLPPQEHGNVVCALGERALASIHRYDSSWAKFDVVMRRRAAEPGRRQKSDH